MQDKKSSELLPASLLCRGWASSLQLFEDKNPNPNHTCFKLLSPLQTVNTDSWELRRELPEHSPVLQVSCRSCYCRSLETAAPGVSWQLCSAELRKISPHPSRSSINPRDQHFPLAPDAGQCQSVPHPACQSKPGAEPPLLSAHPKIHRDTEVWNDYGAHGEGKEWGARMCDMSKIHLHNVQYLL